MAHLPNLQAHEETYLARFYGRKNPVQETGEDKEAEEEKEEQNMGQGVPDDAEQAGDIDEEEADEELSKLGMTAPVTKDEFVAWMRCRESQKVRTFPSSIVMNLSVEPDSPWDMASNGSVFLQQPIGRNEGDRNPAFFFHPVFADRPAGWLKPGALQGWGASKRIADLNPKARAYLEDTFQDSGIPKDIQQKFVTVQLIVEGTFAICNSSSMPSAATALELSPEELWDLSLASGCLAESGLLGAYPSLAMLLLPDDDRQALMVPPRPARPPPGPAPPCMSCYTGGSERRCDTCGAAAHEKCLDEELTCLCCHAPTYAFDWALGDYDAEVMGIDNMLENISAFYREEYGHEPSEEQLQLALETIAQRFGQGASSQIQNDRNTPLGGVVCR